MRVLRLGLAHRHELAETAAETAQYVEQDFLCEAEILAQDECAFGTLYEAAFDKKKCDAPLSLLRALCQTHGDLLREYDDSSETRLQDSVRHTQTLSLSHAHTN